MYLNIFELYKYATILTANIPAGAAVVDDDATVGDLDQVKQLLNQATPYEARALSKSISHLIKSTKQGVDLIDAEQGIAWYTT